MSLASRTALYCTGLRLNINPIPTTCQTISREDVYSFSSCMAPVAMAGVEGRVLSGSRSARRALMAMYGSEAVRRCHKPDSDAEPRRDEEREQLALNVCPRRVNGLGSSVASKRYDFRRITAGTASGDHCCGSDLGPSNKAGRIMGDCARRSLKTVVCGSGSTQNALDVRRFGSVKRGGTCRASNPGPNVVPPPPRLPGR